MLKKHLAVMLLFVMAAGVLSQSIPSGTGRYEALGNTPFILDAATDIYSNPAWSTQYKDYTFGDIGRNISSDFELSDQYAGINFGVGKKLSLGIIVNRRQDLWDNFGGNATNHGISSPVVPMLGIIGYSANKNFHIALAPYYSSWKHDSTSSDTTFGYERNASSLGANLGVIYMMKNKSWVEGAVRFKMNKYKSDETVGSTTNTYDNDGGMEFTVGLRGWFPTKSKTVIVPVLGFLTYSFSPNAPGSSSTNDYSWMNINGGVGLNIPITDDIQLAGGLIGEYNTFKAEYSDTSGASGDFKASDFVLPRFHIAFETRIADWLTGRVGFNRALVMHSEETNASFPGSASTQVNNDLTIGSNSVQTISLGSGFHFGRFSIDATVSERWLKQGINFVSGQNTDLFGVVSASYNFAK